MTCTPDSPRAATRRTFDPEADMTVVLAQGPDGNVYPLTYQPGSSCASLGGQLVVATLV
ncbi:MAG: hypothetical protein ACXWZR_00670 [Mycobacterium sp.]